MLTPWNPLSATAIWLQAFFSLGPVTSLLGAAFICVGGFVAIIAIDRYRMGR